jgi:hypothetical protein
MGSMLPAGGGIVGAAAPAMPPVAGGGMAGMLAGGRGIAAGGAAAPAAVGGGVGIEAGGGSADGEPARPAGGSPLGAPAMFGLRANGEPALPETPGELEPVCTAIGGDAARDPARSSEPSALQEVRNATSTSSAMLSICISVSTSAACRPTNGLTYRSRLSAFC